MERINVKSSCSGRLRVRPHAIVKPKLKMKMYFPCSHEPRPARSTLKRAIENPENMHQGHYMQLCMNLIDIA